MAQDEAHSDPTILSKTIKGFYSCGDYTNDYKS